MAPFCMAGFTRLGMSTRVPGVEMDKLVNYSKDKVRHAIIIR